MTDAGLLQVQEEDFHGAHLLHVSGEGDLSNSATFAQRLLDLAEPGDQKILLDLLQVKFIDSTMVHAILSATAPVRANGGDLMIACAQPEIYRILQITAIDGVFRVFPTVEEGLKELLKR